jgi:hypothetical protein
VEAAWCFGREVCFPRRVQHVSFALTPKEVARRLAEHLPVWAGKTIHEMSPDELKQCALHFRDANIAMHLQRALRRMAKLEMGLTKAQIAKVDWWLEHHVCNSADAVKGDGGKLYFEWTGFELTGNGYREIIQR